MDNTPDPAKRGKEGQGAKGERRGDIASSCRGVDAPETNSGITEIGQRNITLI